MKIGRSRTSLQKNGTSFRNFMTVRIRAGNSHEECISEISLQKKWCLDAAVARGIRQYNEEILEIFW